MLDEHGHKLHGRVNPRLNQVEIKFPDEFPPPDHIKKVMSEFMRDLGYKDVEGFRYWPVDQTGEGNHRVWCFKRPTYREGQHTFTVEAERLFYDLGEQIRWETGYAQEQGR